LTDPVVAPRVTRMTGFHRLRIALAATTLSTSALATAALASTTPSLADHHETWGVETLLDDSVLYALYGTWGEHTERAGDPSTTTGIVEDSPTAARVSYRRPSGTIE
jgi:hypothetical protein